MIDKKYLENEIRIIDSIKTLLGNSFVVDYPNRQRFGSFIPDGCIYFHGELIALVEIKQLKLNIEYYQLYERYSSAFSWQNAPRLIVCSLQGAITFDSKCKKNDIISLESAIEEIKKYYLSTLVSGNEESDFHGVFMSCKKYPLKNTKFANDLESIIHLIDGKIEISGDFVFLPSTFEDLFFRALIGRYHNKKLCRYTSFASANRIVNDKMASLCGIACMNDKSECYYADGYLGQSIEKSLNKMTEDEIAEINKCFILSCTKESKYDNLSMWRLYADDAKGVCINYVIDSDVLKNKSTCWYLAPVSYGRKGGEHPELDYIKSLQEHDFGGKHIIFQRWPIWKHFFKSYDYSDEGEVRLLYWEDNVSKYKWINAGGTILCPVIEFSIDQSNNQFPLLIEEVLLGSKCPELDTNVAQMRQYINSRGIAMPKSNVPMTHVDKIMVYKSGIDNYR